MHKLLRIRHLKSGMVCLKSHFSQGAPELFFDIIISGGGMIGQTMACALSKNPLFKNYKILLIESSPKKDYIPPESYSNRVSSIAPGTKDLFVKLGMWENIRRYQLVKDMKVWGSYSNDYVHFSHETHSPAYIIENDEIINSAVLENSLSSNVAVLYGKTISEVKLKSSASQQHEVMLNDNTSLKSSLLIGADGANSSIRNTMETNFISWKYHQFGIVATLNLTDESENCTAWQKFLPDGPIAILPLKKGLSSLVWSISENKAKGLQKLPDEIFVDAINEALNSEPVKNDTVQQLIGYSKSLLTRQNMIPLMPPYVLSLVGGSRAMFPLGFGHSSEYVKPGVALIGDAAHKVHPLAGQGVNIGFRDIKYLVDNLTRGILDGRPLGHIKDLRRYETQAQRNNIPIMTAIDLFHRVYTSDNNLVRALGNSCINFAESVSIVKNAMKQMATT